MSLAYDYLIFMAGINCGLILFQSSVIAPTVFRVLDLEDAGAFLRNVFPRFFMLVMACSVLMLILVALSDSSDKSRFMLPVAYLVFSGVSYLVIPATNRAKDNEEEKKFKALHSLTVALTLLMLILNITWWLF